MMEKQQQLLTKKVFSPKTTKFRRQKKNHYIKMKHGQLI